MYVTEDKKKFVDTFEGVLKDIFAAREMVFEEFSILKNLVDIEEQPGKKAIGCYLYFLIDDDMPIFKAGYCGPGKKI